MSIDRFSSTRIARGVPWRFVVAAVATAALWHGVRHRHHHHHARAAAHHLHVELAPGQSLTRLAAWDDMVHPLFARPEPALARWYQVDVWLRRGDSIDRVEKELLESGVASQAFEAPDVELAAIDPGSGGEEFAPTGPSCPIKTPSYLELQGYLGPAPGGIDAPAVWDQRGGRGQGVRFADIEGAWNTRHEDLPGDRITPIGRMMPDRAWEAHGTAVVGEVAGKDNGLGVTGIAPDVDGVVVSSIAGNEVADAIDEAQQRLRPGDVLLIELQGMGPGGRWAPVELWPDVYDAIHVATARGVIVVEAAGNGGANLDDKIYKGAFDPARRDSGAIMVGAGGPPRAGFTDRARLDFSNYGRRVDVQGWGRRVATLDYGDLQACSDRADRHYTGEFSGTSSASPIVAGAALQIEGVYQARTGHPLAPSLLRDVLRATGSPQTGARGAPVSQHIGPRPNVPAALAALFGY